MKLAQVVAFGLVVALGAYLGARAQTNQVRITIDSIDANKTISGRVVGISEEARRDFKVLVYVRTNQWYIHPYAGQDEGMSWASIKPDGSWQIRTVRREFAANKIAALLVSRNYPEPDKLDDIGQIQSRAIYIEDLPRGSRNQGKV